MARLPAPGEVAEWLKAADCKSARASVRWFESSPLHQASLKPADMAKNRKHGLALTKDNPPFLAEESILT